MAYARFGFALIMLLGLCPIGCADEIAFGDVDENGKLQNRGLTEIDTARGADGFFLADPMESHDYTHLSVVRNSLLAQLKASGTKTKKLESITQSLEPIFRAMPKDSEGRLSYGTARYALHRFFSQKHGWSIKGLQPAGASWKRSMSIDEDVKDISKYMIPSYIQDVLLKQSGASSFDIQSLATLAATLEHLIHAEMINMVYSVYTTLGLPVPGMREDQQVNDILDTFLMVYAFGVNLDVSNLGDVKSAKLHLNRSHAGWPRLQAFAQEVRRSTKVRKELSFDDVVDVVEKIGQKYAEWQGKDCSRVKDELAAKPSYSKGAVQLSDRSPIFEDGRRQLLLDSRDMLRDLGALLGKSWLIIPNYVNSQSMCLTTASFYAACCLNECQHLLAMVEDKVRAPLATPEELFVSMKLLLKDDILIQELHGLKDQGTGLVAIHSQAFGQWMHKAFPLQCPDPEHNTFRKATNPKTPDEWMSEDGLAVEELEVMTGQIAKAISRYTTMGAKASSEASVTVNPAADSHLDVMRIRSDMQNQRQRGLIPSAAQLGAITSMITLSVAFIRSGIAGLRCWQQKVKKGMPDMSSKDFA